MIEELTLKLSKIKLAPMLRISRKPPDCFFGSDGFARRLKAFAHCDVITYSVSRAFCDCKINRLLYVVGEPPSHASAIKVEGTHMKLWICYKSKSSAPTAFIGSANATDMTLHELMYEATPTQSAELATYFQHIWDLNQSKR